MKFIRIIYITAILAIILPALLMISCKNNSMQGLIILTETPVNSEEVNYVTGEFWRYIPQSRIVAFNPEKPSEPAVVLSSDYFSARVSEVSYNGKSILFAAQRKQADAWQIFEMNLENKVVHQVSTVPENCIDPAYLPGDRVVFSRSLAKDSIGAGHALYTCRLDGSDMKRVSFHPKNDFASDVLADGRILTLSNKMNPGQNSPVLLVLRPDGTKSDVFYYPAEGCILYSRPVETTDGTVFFVEAGKNNVQSGNIISVNQDRPLHSRNWLTEGIKGSFHSILPLNSGKYFVSYRASETDRYGLYEFDCKSNTLGKVIFTDPKFNIEDGVFVEEHSRPKKLPSEVDYKVKTGLLLCQDININSVVAENKTSVLKKAVSIEVLGMNNSLGIVPVESDGSFYLKVMADKPFRLQALDEKGNLIGKPCTWIWIRPNERRGCIGCHEDHDLVPENRIPLSVKKAPVIIPVHITGIKEKQVTLE